jgi:hypothetical protein
MRFGFMNVILLCSDHRHVSATHVAIKNVARARIQIYLQSGSLTVKKPHIFG